MDYSEPEERQSLIQLGSGAPTLGPDGDLLPIGTTDGALFHKVEISTRKKGSMEFFVYVFQKKGSQPPMT